MIANTVRLLLVFPVVLWLTLSVAGKDKVLENKLVLLGKVLSVRQEEVKDRARLYKIELELEFFNAGDEPIIILQPYGQYIFWLGGVSLAQTEAESKLFKYVYSSAAWPSVYHFSEYRELAERLDKPDPPSDYTWTIKPKESRFWKTESARLYLIEKPSNLDEQRQRLTAKEILNLPSPISLRVSLEMWPFNVENFKPGLGGKLRKRWKKDGVLYLEEKGNRYWFGHITSEPIALDLNKAK